MQFSVIKRSTKPPKNARDKAFLIVNDWTDRGKFKTKYQLVIIDNEGSLHSIGDVKIGEFGMQEGQSRPAIPTSFDKLDKRFFSLGQDDSYYERLKGLGDSTRKMLLSALRDVAADKALFAKVQKEHVTIESLLSSVSAVTVQGQFSRLATGGARLTSFQFSYTAPTFEDIEADLIELSFEVEPASNPPSNIHVLIGKNGVGKTRILHYMTLALLAYEHDPINLGKFDCPDDEPVSTLFANLVSVAFSAFDPFEPLPDRQSEDEGIKYTYIGLKNRSKSGPKGALKNLDTLTMEFVRSFQKCLSGSRVDRWRTALTTLEADAFFRDHAVAQLADGLPEDDEDADPELDQAGKAALLFGKLSTGHKMVLLTITRLVETVEEKTLVLIDEPECHLHPPLLSAFIRALSDLLIGRNGVAIVATHSPVVLQEVPAKCVWLLRRMGQLVRPSRLRTETFGENVGLLTKEVFGLDVSTSGFHKLLHDAVEEQPDYNAILEKFSKELGGEARAILAAMIATTDNGR